MCFIRSTKSKFSFSLVGNVSNVVISVYKIYIRSSVCAKIRIKIFLIDFKIFNLIIILHLYKLTDSVQTIQLLFLYIFTLKYLNDTLRSKLK